jgi:hypothetical protein
LRLKTGNSKLKPVFVIKLVLIAGALLLYFFAPSSEWIETHYSTSFYPRVQRTITPISNRVPFAISDILTLLVIIGVPGWWIARIRSAGRGKRAAAVGKLAFGTAGLAAMVFLIFELVWGLNYLREPLTRKLNYDRARVTEAAAIELSDLSVTELNAQSGPVHSSAWPDAREWSRRLQPSFEAAVVELGNAGGSAPGMVKNTIFNFYLTAAGIDGFTNPFGLEVVLDSRLLSQEQPFAMAHEWAHLAGFADESEANFIALISCLGSEDPAVRYAGWLELYPSLPHNTGATAQRSDRPEPAPEVRADLDAVERRRSEGIKPWINTAQWKFYDRFLKANSVQAGVASYGLFIRLVLGTRFNAGWAPQMRSG